MSERELPAGLHPETLAVRVAVGLEHIEDLKADLVRGLDTL